jgi:hypothetical protein
LRDNVEWSFDVETELFIQFSLSWFSLPFISIDDVPLLVDSSVLLEEDDVSVLGILSTLNIHYLSFLVDNESTLVSEELPMS